LRKKIKDTNQPFLTTFTNASAEIETKSLTHLTSYVNLRDYATRGRNEKGSFCIDPHEDIPVSLQYTLNGKKFLQFDSGITSINRFIIFFSSEFIPFIRETSVVIIDGTFKTSPNEF
jgi:hypothetical protein